MSKKNHAYLGLKKKCDHCGEVFYINDQNIGEAIYYGKKTYHSSCFMKYIEEKKNNHRSKKNWDQVVNELPIIKSESYQFYNEGLCKDKVLFLIHDKYEIVKISPYLHTKLGNIYAGTMTGMVPGKGIPPHHLLDMWKRKSDMLDGLAHTNKTKGIEMVGEGRVNYDLAVLVNKYDSYLRWLEKQKVLDSEKNVIVHEDLVTKNIIPVVKNQENENSNDISNLVDDIFG